MCGLIRVLSLVTGACVLSAGAASAQPATILTIRNDTPRVVVVQEVVNQNGQPKRLKPVRLLPGESVRQTETMTGPKMYEVFDAQNPTQSLCTGKVRVAGGSQLIAVATDAKGIVLREVPAGMPVGKK